MARQRALAGRRRGAHRLRGVAARGDEEREALQAIGIEDRDAGGFAASISRSLKRCTLPVAVRGSRSTTCSHFGRLCLGRPRAQAASAAACEEALPRHRRPKWIRAVPDLPRTATGKVQRFRLRELLAGDAAHKG